MATRSERERGRARRARKRLVGELTATAVRRIAGSSYAAAYEDGGYIADCSRSLAKQERLLSRAYEYVGGRKGRSARRRVEGNSAERLKEARRYERELESLADEARAARR